MTMRPTLWLTLFALALLIAVPWIAPIFDLEFYVSLVRRILIYALAATSLNLILGYGGMVALGMRPFSARVPKPSPSWALPASRQQRSSGRRPCCLRACWP